MKRRYQIDQQRAVQQFRQLAREENPNIQMMFPMAEVVGLLQEGVGHLLREAGLSLMNLVMEEEVRHLAGERHQQHPARRASTSAWDRFPVSRYRSDSSLWNSGIACVSPTISECRRASLRYAMAPGRS